MMSTENIAPLNTMATPLDGRHLASHDLIYRGPIRHWQSGIPIGNTNTAAVAFQDEESLCFGITRAGLFDKRNPMHAEKTHEEVKELWKAGRMDLLTEWDARENAHYMQGPSPNPRPAGVLRLGAVSIDLSAIRQRLSLRNATLTQCVEGVEIRSFVSGQSDCLCMSISGLREFTASFTPVVDYPDKGEHWWDSPGCIDSEISAAYESGANGFVGHFGFPGGEQYCVAVTVIGGDVTCETSGPQISLKCVSCGPSVCVYLATATSDDAPDFAEQAVARCSGAALAGFDDLHGAHVKGWHEFWSVNHLLIEDKFLENLFYLNQYILKYGLGGRRPYGNMGAWHLATQPWHGDMHTNINVEMSWLPVFAINRAEVAESFDSHFARDLSEVREETQRFWGVSGLAYPFASLGNLKPLHGGFWRYEVYVSAWVAQVFWDRYRFTGDIDYLREVCYPIQKGVIALYENILENDEAGRLHVSMTKPVESQRAADGSPFVDDMLLEVAAVRHLLSAAIQASAILNEDADVCAKWQDMLDRLCDLPVDPERGVFISYRGASADIPNDHPTLLGPLFPSGLELNTEELRYARASLEHILAVSKRGMEGFPFKNILAWGDDLSYSWLTIAAARLGEREKVMAYLYDFIVLLQLKKNGLFATRPSDVGTRDAKISLINTNGGFTLALTEMLVQSFDSIIRVFPATPPAFTASFGGLKAVGNFTVDAAMVEGDLLGIRLHSGSGGTARLRNDWGEVMVVGESGEIGRFSGDMVCFETERGGSYMLLPLPILEIDFPLEFDTAVRHTPRTWTGPRYLDRVPDSEMWTVSLGQ